MYIYTQCAQTHTLNPMCHQDFMSTDLKCRVFFQLHCWEKKISWIIQQQESSQQQIKIGYSNGQTKRSPSVFDTQVSSSVLVHCPSYIYCFIPPPLQITPESENDFGSYNCTASNEMGTESKEFLLIQAGQWQCCDSKSILTLHL